MKFPTLRLDKRLEPALKSGHPWIYRNHLPKHDLENGDWVHVEAGKAAAVGLYDSSSPIALRLYSQGEVPDRAFIKARVDDALALRQELVEGEGTDTYRLIFGEGDFLPGITVDRYDRFAVVKLYASSVETVLPDVVWALAKALRLKGIVTRAGESLTPLWGELPPPEVTVAENGLKLIANLYSGQKTGLFLDHRDNRLHLSRYCRGKTVLNLFSYTGAFSLYAARGGAKEVTSVDIAPAATQDAKRNFALNGFEPEGHHFVSADVFTLLEDYAKQGRRFDVVILDPPSLAKSKESRHAAIRAYKRLNAQAMRCVKRGGTLATASCTSQVSPEAFRLVLAEAAQESGRRLQILHEAGHAPDHPVPAAFPEGRYLKFMMGRVL